MKLITFTFCDNTESTMQLQNIPAMGENVKFGDKIFIVDDVTHDLANNIVIVKLI